MATILSSPSTPTSHRSYTDFANTPTNSSPLAHPADSSPVRSPISSAQERRRSQYKTAALSTPSANQTRSSRRVSTNSAPPPRLELPGLTEEAPGKRFLRERFRARCLERALKDRARKVSGKRHASDWSSDGPEEMMDFDDDDEEEDEDESMLNDAFFSRIMASVKHKRQHSYRVSYAQEVGSSFDPDMQDVTEWEHELREPFTEEVPDDLDEDELAAYAAEQELLEGLTADDLFSYSDVDDVPYNDEEAPSTPVSKGKQRLYPADDLDVEMEM